MFLIQSPSKYRILCTLSILIKIPKLQLHIRRKKSPYAGDLIIITLLIQKVL